MLEISGFAQIEMNWWDKNAVSYFDMKKGRETDSVHFTGNRELGSHLQPGQFPNSFAPLQFLFWYFKKHTLPISYQR